MLVEGLNLLHNIIMGKVLKSIPEYQKREKSVKRKREALVICNDDRLVTNDRQLTFRP